MKQSEGKPLFNFKVEITKMWSKVKQTHCPFQSWTNYNVKRNESWTNTNVKLYESHSLFNLKSLAYKNVKPWKWKQTIVLFKSWANKNVKQREGKLLFNFKAELTKWRFKLNTDVTYLRVFCNWTKTVLWIHAICLVI